MAYAMAFHAIWPLLRKEGWTWKPATGIQIHYNYLKPGRKLRGGKRGVDFFNGEDELLSYICTDKQLCEWLGIRNIMERSQHQANVSTPRRYSVSDEETYEPSDEDDEDEEELARRSIAGAKEARGEEGEAKDVDEQQPRNGIYNTLRDSACGKPLRFDSVDPLDPNIVGDTDETALETDGEGGEDSAEGFMEGVADTDSDAVLPGADNIQQQLRRITKLLGADELERLHMRVQGKLCFS
ncbi:uncharacterized protein IUM83_04766 [Phytophthora cinnamomi]|uniref:uncharacterized protein n=1 Tax=Phytophthora cinnamomi TaxID=4785 RepID=UPI00355A0654|nr:hypothetical protein IUM83_04766 [Phytophthora cinnamomi]